MCLQLFKSSRKVTAQKDIVCYKVLGNKPDGIYSPYQNFKYNLNEIYSTNLGEKQRYVVCGGTFIDACGIYEGFHSFKRKIDAISMAVDANRMMNMNTLHIYKCIIPKGASYYTGFFTGKESYCSNQIIIEKEIE